MNRKECRIGYFEWEDKPRLLFFATTNNDPQLEDVDSFRDAYYEILEKMHGPFVIVFDVSKTMWVSHKVRNEVGIIAKDVENKYHSQLKRVFLVVTNPILNVIIKGVYIIANLKIPQEVHINRDSAFRAANNELAKWSYTGVDR